MIRFYIRALLLITLLAMPFASHAISSKSTPAEIYVAFEQVFFGYNDMAVEPWLADEYELQQHTHVMNFLEESRTLTREKVLYSIEQAGNAAETPRATADQVEIVEQSPEAFCMSVQVEGQARFMGRALYEISTREGCFQWREARWQIISHKMNNRYQLAPPQTGDQKPSRR